MTVSRCDPGMHSLQNFLKSRPLSEFVVAVFDLRLCFNFSLTVAHKLPCTLRYLDVLSYRVRNGIF